MPLDEEKLAYVAECRVLLPEVRITWHDSELVELAFSRNATTPNVIAHLNAPPGLKVFLPETGLQRVEPWYESPACDGAVVVVFPLDRTRRLAEIERRLTIRPIRNRRAVFVL